MSDRRRFLVGAGASILVASTLSEWGEAQTSTTTFSFAERGGVSLMVWNSDLPGLSGQLLLNVDLAVSEHGTGFATIGDVVHPQVNCHVEITETRRQGNEFQFDGKVIRSNDSARVGQQVLVVATMHGGATRLALKLGEETFTGPGFTGNLETGLGAHNRVP